MGAAYGSALIPRLAEDLTRRYGRGFAWRNLTHPRQAVSSMKGPPRIQEVKA